MTNDMANPYLSTYVTKATKRDLAAVFQLVNSAYTVEIGNEGIGYKNCDKYILKDQTRKQLGDMWLLRNHRQVTTTAATTLFSHK